MMARIDPHLPLPSLLSHALSAFTIEFDNEFEHQVPHRTSNHGATRGSKNTPWLVSMVMWSKFLRFIPDDGIRLSELHDLLGMDKADLALWLTRLGKWWGYIFIKTSPADIQSKPLQSGVVRLTPGGRAAVEAWRPLTALIESRWRDRFGKAQIEELKQCLQIMSAQLPPDLPEYLPILRYGLFSNDPNRKPQSQPVRESNASLPGLLSKVLLAFAVEFENRSDLSLAISANALRVLNGQGVQMRDLPRLSGVSKEAIAMSLKFLAKKGCVGTKTASSGSRSRIVALTPKGLLAQERYRHLLGKIEEQWCQRFGEDVEALRDSLEQLTGTSTRLLFRGLQPYPEGWRAALPKLEVLPHYPMVLHRGGFPDGR